MKKWDGCVGVKLTVAGKYMYSDAMNRVSLWDLEGVTVRGIGLD